MDYITILKISVLKAMPSQLRQEGIRVEYQRWQVQLLLQVTFMPLLPTLQTLFRQKFEYAQNVTVGLWLRPSNNVSEDLTFKSYVPI